MKVKNAKQKLLRVLLAIVMMFTNVPMIVNAEESVAETDPALANIVDIHPLKGELEGNIYGMDEWAKEFISITDSACRFCECCLPCY